MLALSEFPIVLNVTIIIISINLVLLYLCCGKRKLKAKRSTFYEIISLKSNECEEDQTQEIEPNNLFSNYSKPIEVNHFQEYLVDCMKEDLKNNELNKQFMSVSKIISEKNFNQAGNQPQNIKKNRYLNVIPYDSTRVVLRNNLGNDYINANYIKGYNSRRAFIATQAPLNITTNNFWEMIWQENVDIIIMLTKLKEGSVIKSEQYWPDSTITFRYGEVEIEVITTTVFVDHIYREFKLQCGTEQRCVQHYQYESWLDHAVPNNIENFTIFYKKIKLDIKTDTPIVVHCNAGCGRTGVFILCDIILRMAKKENQVDFLKVLATMRSQRPNMVTNVSQYIVAHFIVAEHLFEQNFSIPVNSYYFKYIELNLCDNVIERIMKNLGKAPNFKKLMNNSSLSHMDDFPDTTIIDSFDTPGRFLATPQPKIKTISNFWNLIVKFNVKTILLLNETETTNDINRPQFWPDQIDSVFPLDNFILKYVTEKSFDFYKVMALSLSDHQGNSYKKINFIEIKNWNRNLLTPNDPKSLIDVWNKLRRKQNKIVLTCYDGATACGVFAALAFLLEKIEIERICDVYSAAKNVRQSGSGFLHHSVQIEFLYKAALLYLEQFKPDRHSENSLKN